MVGLVRRAQDGTVIVGGQRTAFRIEPGTAEYGPWLLIETNEAGATTVRPFSSELDALMYVVGALKG